MLGTLMKYEFKAVGRVLLPLYAACVVISIMLGLSLRSDGVSEPSNFLIVITALLFVFAIVVSVVITAVILIQRFYKNLLGDEGYFMFTLPVSTGKHVSGKIISGALWIIIGSLVAILSMIAIGATIEGPAAIFADIKFMVGDIEIAVSRSPSSIFIIFELLLLAVIGCASSVAKVYAAISIGHQWSSHRVLGAILAYIIISTVESVIGFFAELTILDIASSWFYELGGIGQTHVMLLGCIAACGLLLAIYWFASWKLLDKHLNLE